MSVASIETTVFNPRGFDPAAALPRAAPKIYDRVRLFLDRLYAVRYREAYGPRRYIPVHTDELRRVLGGRDYTSILDQLRDRGVVEIDPQYIPGERSRGYRLTAEWLNSPPEVHRVRVPRTTRVEPGPVGPIEAWARDNIGRVEVVARPAEDEHAEFCLNAIKAKRIFTVRCAQGRLHTNLTNLSKSARANLMVEGEGLWNCDVANSQPLILGLICTEWHRNGCRDRTNRPLERHQRSPQTRQTRKEHPEAHPAPHHKPLMSPHRWITTSPGADSYDVSIDSFEVPGGPGDDRRDLPDDLVHYLRLVEAGGLYQSVADKFGVSREEAKEACIANWLFSEDHRRYPLARCLAAQFPTVNRCVLALKSRGYEGASLRLQKMESVLMIDGVADEIRRDRPDVWAGTIHDSILTPWRHVGYVESVMRKHFAAVGLRPTIRREDCAQVAGGQYVPAPLSPIVF